MKPEAISNAVAEMSVVASIVADRSLIAEVVGAQLEASDFVSEDARALYATTVELFYSDTNVEPLVVAERAKRTLAPIWRCEEQHVAQRLLNLISERPMGGVMEHAGIVKELATRRRLLAVFNHGIQAIAEGDVTPEEIAGTASTEALAVTSGLQSRSELYDWMATGREYAVYLRRQRLARERGIEMAVYSGLPFIDNYTKGIAPTELCFLGGAPGTGKSIIGWKAAEGFAMRQMRKAEEHRIGSLVCSLEMGLVPSATRLAQSIASVDGMRLREGDISDREYTRILREWKARDKLPIYFNYASNFRLSQLRALVVESIRKFNVGFVVIDHFRQLDTDKFVRDANDRDEIKVRWLKEAICKDLNVAVLCLGHTVKLPRDAGARPRMDDLRGSGQIAANADFVGLLHRPSRNLDDDEQLALNVVKTDAELHWVKARHTDDGIAHFGIEPATMSVWSK